jgi:hypothetical protein
MVPVYNVLAYLLGPVALAEPAWLRHDVGHASLPFGWYLRPRGDRGGFR